MSEESIKNPSRSDNSFTPKRAAYPISKINFNGNSLKQDSVSFLHKNLVNLLQTRYMVKRFPIR